MKIRFKDEQPPCIPTDLHCEFITESIKNGNNLMTEVFLSYSNEDRTTMEKIRNSLRRVSITVWTNTTDIQTGEAFEEAIKWGIEQTDNLVYLLSPDSINSIYCQQELDLALSLNKRIIPVLVRETDPTQVPSALWALHYIDLTDNVNEDDYLLDESQLLKILHQDAAYYNEHKMLLTKALKWKRQYSNPSILLRGYNLRSAEAWLKVAKARTQHLPTPLMEEFIEESLRQPPAASLDVFISYSRKDSDFARKLNDELQLQGKTTWFDQESIASGADFAEEIKQGINACNNILFILSPRSINSPYCKGEVEYAASLNKRFVTVLHQEVNPADLPPELAKVQWIDFNQNEGDFNANFKQLVRTLDTDREHLRYHTKWSQRALDWEQEERSEDLLLRGGELAIAQNWLQETQQKQKKPLPTTKQREFITTAIELRDLLIQEREENRQRELRQARRIAIGSVAAGIVMTSLALFATYQSRQATIGQIRSAIASAKVYLSSEQKLDALVNSVSAAVKLKQMLLPPPLDLRQQVQATLQRTTHEVQEINRLQGHDNVVVSISFSPDGQYLATTSEDGTARLWDLQGNQKALFQGHEPELPVMSVSFSPNGQSLATGSLDGTVRLWDLQGNQKAVFKESGGVMSVAFSPNGQSLATGSLDGTVRLWDLQGKEIPLSDEQGDPIMSVSFSPNGQSLATGSLDGTARLWDLQGQEIAKFEHDSWVNDVDFTPDGQSLITASEEGIARLWNLQGKKLMEFRGNNKAIKISNVSVSPNGQYLATASGDGTAQLWSLPAGEFAHLHEREGHQVFNVSFATPQGYLATASEESTVLWDLQGKELTKFPLSSDEVVDVSFSPDGKYLATASTDGTVHLWTIQGETVAVLAGHDDVVLRVRFSPKGEHVATASEDGTAKLWDLQGNEVAVFQGHEAGVADVSFSPDGKYLATASGDDTARLWNRQGEEMRVFKGHNNLVGSVSFSPDSQRVVTTSSDKTARLWDLQGNELLTLPHQDSVERISFHPDGKQLVTASENGLVYLWNLQGKKLASFPAHNQSIDRINFSSDGQYLATVSYSKARVWGLEDFDTLISRGCTWVRGYLKTNPDVDQNERHICDRF